jgi:enoyl-CoA hydratase
MTRRLRPQVPTVQTAHPRSGVIVVTLNRPHRLNAMTHQLTGDLSEVLTDVACDDECRVVVLTGAGRAFLCWAGPDRLRR